jgi:PAS domain S-box-containing protein
MKPPPPRNAPRQLEPWQTQPLNIALAYAVIAGFWIITGDTIINLLVSDNHAAQLVSSAKNWVFLIISSAALWWFSKQLLFRISTAETDLREGEQQARAIFNGVSDAIFIHDAQTGEILDVNETACRMFGYTKQKLLALNIGDLSSGDEPYTQENAMAFFAKTLMAKQDPIEWHSRQRDGTLFWTELNARSAEIANHQRILVTGRDIDKRKQATKELRKLSQAVEQSPVSIIITDTTGNIEYVNPAACQLTGYSAKELLGKNPRILRPDHIHSEKFDQMWETIRNGRQLHGEFRNRKKDGSLYWELATICPITDDTGKTTHILGVKEDITERKKAEEQLKHQEALLEETGEIAHVGGWEFDPVTGAGSYSTEVARILGIEPMLSLNEASSLSFFQGESRTALEAARATAQEHGTPYDLELEMLSADGHQKWIRTICRPVLENGRIVRVRGTLQDITDRKRADQELQQSRVQLRALLARLQKAREDERTRISREVHDVLGQLLTGIKMDISWCERRLPRIGNDETRNEMAGKLTSITALTDTMLDSVQKISRDLRPSLLDNLGLVAALHFESRQFTERTGIPCEITSIPSSVELSPDDTTQVFRIFQEILTNVARHSDASQVSVALLRQRGELILTVEDNGCGISSKARQDTNSLGLLGMAERAALIGGTIRFHGAPGAGTKVGLTVPEMPPTNSSP